MVEPIVIYSLDVKQFLFFCTMCLNILISFFGSVASDTRKINLCVKYFDIVVWIYPATRTCLSPSHRIIAMHQSKETLQKENLCSGSRTCRSYLKGVRGAHTQNMLLIDSVLHKNMLKDLFNAVHPPMFPHNYLMPGLYVVIHMEVDDFRGTHPKLHPPRVVCPGTCVLKTPYILSLWHT